MTETIVPDAPALRGKTPPRINAHVVAEVLRSRLSDHVSTHYANGSTADFSTCQKLGCIEMRQVTRAAYLQYIVDDDLVTFHNTLRDLDVNLDRFRYMPGTGQLVAPVMAEAT